MGSSTTDPYFYRLEIQLNFEKIYHLQFRKVNR